MLKDIKTVGQWKVKIYPTFVVIENKEQNLEIFCYTTGTVEVNELEFPYKKLFRF